MTRHAKTPKVMNDQVVTIGNRNLKRTVRGIKWSPLNRTLRGQVQYKSETFAVLQKDGGWVCPLQ